MPASSDVLSTAVSARALERGLDELAQRVRGDVEPLAFLTDALRLLVHTARADRAAFWMHGGAAVWTRIPLSVQSTDGAVQPEPNAAAPDWLAGALQQAEPEATRFTTDGTVATRLAGPIRQGGQPTGVLEAAWEGAIATQTLLPFVGAVCELTGDFLVQHELRMLRRERIEGQRWHEFQSALAAADSLSRLATVLTHDGRVLTSSDRVSVVSLHGWRVRAEAVSGVDVLDPRSPTLQALEQVAATAAKSPQPLWQVAAESPSNPAYQSWQQVVHGQALAALPLCNGGVITGVLLCERLTDAADPAAWRPRCETLARYAAPAWSAAIERRRSWWSRWTRRRTLGSLAAWFVVVGAIAAGALLLAVIPAEQIITAEGQLLPEQRRDVFASTSGLVDELHVQHGDEVIAGQALVVLRDPQTELERARVVGELATVRTRLGVVQAARIAALASGLDAAIRAQQLTGEEEELKQRLESLVRQQALLDEQRTTWELRSPIDGQVLTWDLESRLIGRPVERGQVLLTVGDLAGEWVIEARIRERDVGVVWTAMQSRSEPLPVEFVTTLDAQVVRHGTVRILSRTAEIDDRGDSTLRVTIAFDRQQPGLLRPGATVLPRIHCGRTSLGRAWLRHLIDAVRRQWWLWR